MLALRNLFPLQLSKAPRTPNFVQCLSQRLFLVVPVRGSKICETIFGQILTNPPKQSSGHIVDKFGVRGVFESCKGKKVSQCLLGICREFARKSELARNSLGKRPGPAMRGSLQWIVGLHGLHKNQFVSALRMTGRRSHWTERGDDNIFYVWPHCGALVPSLAENGLIVMGPSCVNSLYPSPESLGRK